MKPASDVPLMMKGTPCSRGKHAPLKASSKTPYVTPSVNPAKRVRARARSSHDSPESSDNITRGGLLSLLFQPALSEHLKDAPLRGGTARSSSPAADRREAP